jgi:hypothetical protein
LFSDSEGCKRDSDKKFQFERFRSVADGADSFWSKGTSSCFPTLSSKLRFVMVIEFKKIRWMRGVEFMGQMSNAHQILAGKPERKRPLEDLRNRGKIMQGAVRK